MLLHNQVGWGVVWGERKRDRDRVHTGKKRGVRKDLIKAKQFRKTK